jgi:glyoxylase-like metal-dependent hydrolase (beta-lactamase superfamily II)
VGDASHIASIAATRGDGPGCVIVTHAHGDHISGVTAIAERWPATTFAKIPWPERDAKYRVKWQPLHDEQLLPAGDGTLQVIHTPGHAPDHVALWDAESRTIFSGDLVVIGTTVVIPATMGGSLAAYLRSLERLLALNPARLLPAHGPAIDDPQTIIGRYLSHRREREEQIRRALAEGLHRVEAIVERIYVGLPPVLVPMAQESVLAHLLKLADEHAVRRDGDEWHLE